MFNFHTDSNTFCILIFIVQIICIVYVLFSSQPSKKYLWNRMALLVMLIDALGGIWTLEQPSSSLIWKHHRFQQLIRMYQVSRLVLASWGVPAVSTISRLYLRRRTARAPKRFLLRWFGSAWTHFDIQKGFETFIRVVYYACLRMSDDTILGKHAL